MPSPDCTLPQSTHCRRSSVSALRYQQGNASRVPVRSNEHDLLKADESGGLLILAFLLKLPVEPVVPLGTFAHVPSAPPSIFSDSARMSLSHPRF